MAITLFSLSLMVPLLSIQCRELRGPRHFSPSTGRCKPRNRIELAQASRPLDGWSLRAAAAAMACINFRITTTILFLTGFVDEVLCSKEKNQHSLAVSRKKNMIKKLIFAVLMAVASMSSYATEYITNGTFSDYANLQTFQQTGWTTNSDYYYYLTNTYLEGAIGNPGTLSQSISGATGALTLSFNLEVLPNSGIDAYESVIFDGVTLATFTAASLSTSAYTYNVIGTGNDTLSFVGKNYDYFTLIANVSLIESPVVAVPEPETYGMMLGGLGLLSFMASRKRKA